MERRLRKAKGSLKHSADATILMQESLSQIARWEGKGKAHERKAKKDRSGKAAKPGLETKGDAKDSDGFRGSEGEQVSEGADKSQQESDEAEAD